MERVIEINNKNNGEQDRGRTLIWNKRAFEHFHVFCWVLKDTAWIRAWDWRLVLSIGTLVLVISTMHVCIDAWTLAKNQCHVLRLLHTKEFICSIIQILWVLGSIIWACGECYDLRTNAEYGDVYNQYLGLALWFLAAAAVLGTVFWIFVIYLNTIPFPKWYNTILDDWYTAYGRNSDPEECDRPVYVSHETHSGSIATLEGEEGCDVIINGRDDIIGIPRLLPGICRIPSGQINFKTRQRLNKSKWVFTSGFLSFRELELFLLYVWAMKDLGWALQDKSAYFGETVAFMFGATAVVTASLSAIWVLTYSKRVSEVVHAMAVLMWVLADMTWCWAEFLGDEETFPDRFPDAASNARFLLPPLFTPLSELPPNTWLCRFFGSWVLMLDVCLLSGYYVYKGAEKCLMRTNARPGFRY